MSGPLQNKLQQFEVAPPPDVWDKIARRLDEEYVISDTQLSAKVEAAAIAPPAGVWEKVNEALNANVPVEESPRKVIPLITRIAVAATIVGVLFLGGLYFLTSNKPGNSIVEKVTEKATKPLVDTKPRQQKLPDTDSHAIVAASQSSDKIKKDNIRPVPKPRVIDEEAPEDVVDDVPLTDYTARPEEAPLYDLQTVSALQPVSVTAPPLRDKKGNIILDASLISHPDDEYITITGPNGKQTKISSKFLSCLGYINGNLTTNDVDTRAIQCKTQFEEWRKKILAQPAFIPTANNFFDIFELKDLLQEM